MCQEIRAIVTNFVSFYGHALKLGVELKWQGKSLVTHDGNSSFHLAHQSSLFLTVTQTSGSQHSFFWLNLNFSTNVYSTQVRFLGPLFYSLLLNFKKHIRNPTKYLHLNYVSAYCRTKPWNTLHNFRPITSTLTLHRNQILLLIHGVYYEIALFSLRYLFYAHGIPKLHPNSAVYY